MDVITLALPLLIGLIVVALVFDFLNGLHDAANSIATIVSTRVLRPQHAVVWAAVFNFAAFLIFGSHVAQTVGTGIVSAEIVDPRVVFGALMGAISWNIITWALGIPSSSSHALIGGLVGAGTAKVGISAIVWGGLAKTSAAIGLGTLIGGWRIVHTMGSRITRLRPFQGFCAETGGAITLFTATYFGIPVSTTHTITGAIIGVGAARSVSSVRWKVANNIVFAW